MGGDILVHHCAMGLSSGGSEVGGWKEGPRLAGKVLPWLCLEAGWVPTVLVPNLP